MPLYAQNGSLLADGSSLRGCCCPAPPSCHYFAWSFTYSYSYIPVATDASGLHEVSLSFGGSQLVARSETWNGDWGNQNARGTGDSGCGWWMAVGKATGYGNGIQPGDGSGTFEFEDNRTFDEGQQNPTVSLVLHVQDSGQGSEPNRIYGLKIGSSVYRPASQGPQGSDFPLGSWPKTRFNTISWSGNFQIVR